MAWNATQRRNRRDEYARNHSTNHHPTGKPVHVPADVVILDRDPSPCFFCGEREGCKHRTAFGW